MIKRNFARKIIVFFESQPMTIHFIAIGGAAMHSLAIALHKQGHTITGSDDELFEPASGNLATYGLLPEALGWFPERITKSLDAVIVGMHAREDNPELMRARELILRIFSYPEFLLEHTQHKTRVVIGGSHGKTTVTSMILYVLKKLQMDFDYMVGARVEGFETMVGFSDTSRIAVFEGDEYLSSPMDPRPKFHIYRPHIAVVTGISWDHINVFPTFEQYIEAFRSFSEKIERDGKFIYYEEDPNLQAIAQQLREDLTPIPYTTHPYEIRDGQTYLLSKQEAIPIKLFGRHNLQNIQAARLVCRQLGVSDRDFYRIIADFKGADRRLQVIGENDTCKVFLDFAHSPSKLKATIEAVKEQFPDRTLIACMELHTFSSLNPQFLPEYHGSMSQADKALVYYDPQTLEHKRMAPLSPAMVAQAFGNPSVQVYTDPGQLTDAVKSYRSPHTNWLFMSSGHFDGLDLKRLALELTE
jgi:UDP-N-acetylmuramate: L-alanyl-gamma-D-glutamyl-meso-diaminopimelate ligase